MMNSECELDLRFQTAVVSRFVEALAVLPTGNLVGKSEVRRCDVSDDRTGIRVVQQVADRQSDAQVETVRCGGRAEKAAKATAGGGLQCVTGAATWVAACASRARIAGGCLARRAEADNLRDA